MKRIWFTQQQKLYCNYLPLRWGLGQYTDAQIDTLSGLFKPDAPDNPEKIYCPKIYTTRTHPLSGEYIVVEGSRFKAKPVEPKIEFRATPICLIDFKNKVFLDVNSKKFFAEWDFFTTYSNEKGHTTFPELDLGIKGATFEMLRNELLRLNKKATTDTPFYVNKLEPINHNWRITEKGNTSQRRTS